MRLPVCQCVYLGNNAFTLVQVRSYVYICFYLGASAFTREVPRLIGQECLYLGKDAFTCFMLPFLTESPAIFTPWSEAIEKSNQSFVMCTVEYPGVKPVNLHQKQILWN